MFKTRAKNDPPNVERRAYTMFLVKHKVKQPEISEEEAFRRAKQMPYGNNPE